MALEPIANSAGRFAENILKESVREVLRRHHDGQLSTQKAGTLIAKRPAANTKGWNR